MIPPEWFPPELQLLLYVYIFPTVAILSPFISILFWKFLIPEPAKEIIKNKVTKLPFHEIETDDGYTILERAKTYPEGVVVSLKRKFVAFLARPISRTKVEGKQYSVVEGVETVALKRSILKGTGCPIVHSYGGKAIATNLSTLVGLEYSGQSRMKEMRILDGIKKGGKGWVVNVLLPVDPRSMKRWFTQLWNQSQIKARDNISERIGYERGKGELKRIMIPLAFIIMVFVIGMIFLMVMGGNIGGS